LATVYQEAGEEVKVYIVGSDAQVEALFTNRNHTVTVIRNPLETAELLENPDLVVFTGGADVWPVLYGEKNTDSNIDIRRDLSEMIWFKRFLRVPKLGICRGGQFLNVMNGGKMEQHHPHHAIAGYHLINDYITGARLAVTSTHHQVMLAGPGSAVYGTALDMPDGIDTNEILYYGNTHSLCFQPHPEYGVGDKGNQTLLSLTKQMKYVFGKDTTI
jgi:gamma-glutamyl-gamma-aminobutyrate hydrolase PuuD